MKQACVRARRTAVCWGRGPSCLSRVMRNDLRALPEVCMCEYCAGAAAHHDFHGRWVTTLVHCLKYVCMRVLCWGRSPSCHSRAMGIDPHELLEVLVLVCVFEREKDRAMERKHERERERERERQRERARARERQRERGRVTTPVHCLNFVCACMCV